MARIISAWRSSKRFRINLRIAVGRKNKPNYGLWASPVGAEYGWADWCEGEEFHTELLEKSFTFTLTDDAKVLTVRSLADVENYIRKMPAAGSYSMSYLYKTYLDFVKIMRDFDAMELIHGDNYWKLHNDMFYTWDVDSIVIWNPDIIIF